ncbi:MAG: DUF6350 family protein [Nocardioidaceae bacterium]
MTSLLSARSDATAADLRHRRPLVLIALLGGASAALTTLLVCLAVGVVGWYAADAGAHGVPRDALRTGALGWLMAHGSGVRVGGAWVSAMPLGLTALCAWTCWRLGHRIGDSVSGHGPDADRIADGERDWTVPSATVLFGVGYAAVVLVTHELAATAATSPSLFRAVLWTVLLSFLVAGPAIAAGSGRLAIWATFVPDTARDTLVTARRILTHVLGVSLALWLVSLAVDGASAANVVSQLHLGTADTVAFVGLSALLVPNATLFSGSYLLGPGFAVGTGTLVSPTAVVLGPLPLFPMLAALPDAGTTPAWTPYLMAAPVVVAAVATARTQRARPTLRWDQAALRGGIGGMLAGLAFALLAATAGGSVGPGRMRNVGVDTFAVLVHGLPAFAIGGLVGALLTTFLQRRRSRPSPAAPEA